LRVQGFKAFYVAIGAQNGRKLNIENEDHPDVMSGVDFLRQVNLGQAKALSGRVIVIGGGNVAIDVARTAVRTPAESVTLVSLESRAEMPALPDELAEAEAEQVGILNGWGPQRILVHNGKITGVQFKRCVSVFDANKRFSPVYDESDTMIVAADHVLVSVGQSIAWGKLLEGSGAQLNPNQTLKADALTYQTHQPDVFTGGDCYSGPRFAIDAIAAGKQGAISIHRFVHPGQSLVNGRDRRQYQAIDTTTLDLNGYDRVERQHPLVNHPSSLKGNFNDPRSTLTEAQIQAETQRCLGCGMAIVDPYDCVGCGQCTTKCRFEAISLVRTYDSPGAAFEALKPLVIKTALKREARLMAKSLIKPFVKD
jgi:thioredoxin reductase/NAD-dependent dihydropyrimidine dehydrogenase PreA subunit